MAEDPFNSYMNVQVSLLSIYLRSSALFSLLSTLSSTMFNLNAHSILYSNVFQKGELTLHRISRYQIVRSTTVCLQLQVVKRHREPHWSTNHTLLLHVHLLGFFVVVFCNSARRIIWSSLILNFPLFFNFLYSSTSGPALTDWWLVHLGAFIYWHCIEVACTSQSTTASSTLCWKSTPRQRSSDIFPTSRQRKKENYVETSSVRQFHRGGWIVLGYIMQCEVITRGEEAALTSHDPLLWHRQGRYFNVVLVVRWSGSGLLW